MSGSPVRPFPASAVRRLGRDDCGPRTLDLCFDRKRHEKTICLQVIQVPGTYCNYRSMVFLLTCSSRAGSECQKGQTRPHGALNQFLPFPPPQGQTRWSCQTDRAPRSAQKSWSKTTRPDGGRLLIHHGGAQLAAWWLRHLDRVHIRNKRARQLKQGRFELVK